MNQNNKLILNILLIFVIFLTISGFLEDIKNTFQFGGVDLRNKVVGARLLKRDMDPYFYKWQQGDPLVLLDPRDKVEKEVSMVTVPPSLLQLILPFADIRYNIQRIIWLFVQWFLFLFSIYLFTKTAISKRDKKLIWLLCLFFISSSFFWRLHVERGQVYIFYVALLSLIYFIYRSNMRNSSFWSGMLLGFSVILRPTLALVGVPFLLHKKWKFISGAVAGGVISFVISVVLSGWEMWLSYFRAMKIYGEIHLLDLELAASAYPYSNIEGIENLYGLANIPIFDSSIQFLFKSIGVIVPGSALLIVFILLLSTAFFFLRKIKLTEPQLFLLGTCFVFLVDFFLAAPRFSYNNVMFLPILAIVILESKNITGLLKT
ncbi:glycosyltransferase family 87 protein [Candidatus Cloacimonadota bacterium]